MKPLPPPRGFSLVEVALALAIVCFAIVGLLALFGTALDRAHASRDESVTVQLARTLRARLNDPAWPAGRRESERGWTATVDFSTDGAVLASSARDAAIRAELSAGPGLGFQSERIEAIHVRFTAVGAAKPFGDVVLQRLTDLATP